MRKKPDAYELNFCGRPKDVIKCESCGFKAVMCQFTEHGGCPACESKTDDTERGLNKKSHQILKGKYKKGGQ